MTGVAPAPHGREQAAGAPARAARPAAAPPAPGHADEPPALPAGASAAPEAVRGSDTVGVEEEFVLVGADDRHPVPRAAEVLEAAAHGPALPGGVQLKAELLASQAESASGVCTRLDELARQLGAARRRLAGTARAAGLLAVSTGTPVLAAPTGQLTPGDRYRHIAGIYAGVVEDYAACGCHVHVGVPDRETAVAVTNHLRPWLPTLLALSANSPFHQGRDTGYGSWRMVLQSRFPGSGVPPYFPSAAAHDAEVERLVGCGVLADVRQSFWLARPSARFPTVELRVADAAATVDEAVLQAALSRALVRTARTELAAGRTARPVAEQVAAAAVWNAARYGLGGPGVDPVRATRAPARDLLGALVDHVAPALEEAGDLHHVRRLLDGVLAHGTGADRQRAAAAGGLTAAVDRLAHETVRAPTPLGRTR